MEEGNRLVKFSYEGIFEEILDQLGQMPLPPYITHELEDRNRYQTVYAEYEGSAAAPTAGLHFTKELLAEIEDMGVSIARVTLHVGLGTFRPVKVEDVAKHHMHTEYYRVTEQAANIINGTKKRGGRVICGDGGISGGCGRALPLFFLWGRYVYILGKFSVCGPAKNLLRNCGKHGKIYIYFYMILFILLRKNCDF